MEGCSGCGGHNRLIFISQLKPFCGMLRFSCIAHFRQHFQAKAVGVVFAVFGVGARFAAMPQSNNNTLMKDVTGDYRSSLEDCCHHAVYSAMYVGGNNRAPMSFL